MFDVMVLAKLASLFIASANSLNVSNAAGAPAIKALISTFILSSTYFLVTACKSFVILNDNSTASLKRFVFVNVLFCAKNTPVSLIVLI